MIFAFFVLYLLYYGFEKTSPITKVPGTLKLCLYFKIHEKAVTYHATWVNYHASHCQGLC